MYPTIVKSKEFSDFMNKSIASIEIPTKFNEHDFFKEYYPNLQIIIYHNPEYINYLKYKTDIPPASREIWR